MASVNADMASALAPPPPAIPLPNSRMSQLYTRHRSILARLDDLESRLASRVAAHRRRATNLIGETPTTRKSHMRIFISHRIEGGADDVDADEDKAKDDEEKADADGATATTASATAAASRPSGGKDFSALLHSSAHQNAAADNDSAATTDAAKKAPPRQQQPKKGVRKWTLVIEGGLLIKQLDHESAKEVDVKLEAGLPILGCKGSDDENDGDEEGKAAQKNNAAHIPLRDQWRGGTSERENEKDIEPLHFTHLFDKLEVEMKVFHKSDTSEPAETAAVTRSGLGSVPEAPPPAPPSTVKTMTWERSKSDAPDSHAFFVAHEEESEFKPMGGKAFKSEFNVERVVARVKLYRRRGDDDSYVPSAEMCDVFFPTFVGKKAAGEVKSRDKSGSKSKKRKRAGGGGGSDALLRSTSASSAILEQNEASNSSVGSLALGKEAAFASRQAQSGTAPGGATSASSPATAGEEKDVHVPYSVTMDEVLHAIFFYIRSRNLQDATDLSIINNDEKLSNLFGCGRMLFSAVRGLLVEKQLLVKVEPCTQPIIFNYDMTLEGAEPLTKKRRVKTSAQCSDATETTTRTRSDNILSEPELPEEIPHQTMLSCDVDVEVPNLFHVRTRDILRRTKYREFEYTSGRIKAIRSLTAARVGEETAKQTVGDIVTGRGYAQYHQQAWMALAKGSHDGGEAQKAAWIDLRTATLMEKLEEQCSVARGWWDVVDACRSLCVETP